MTLRNYKVWLRSTPGFYSQYDGAVSVFAEDEDDAIDKAFVELKRGVFPDRGRSMWKIERVERIYK